MDLFKKSGDVIMRTLTNGMHLWGDSLHFVLSRRACDRLSLIVIETMMLIHCHFIRTQQDDKVKCVRNVQKCVKL